MNEETAREGDSSTHAIWGVVLKAPTRTGLMAVATVFFVVSFLAITLLPINWPLLSAFLATILLSSLAGACGIDSMQGWKHIRLLMAGNVLIAALTYFIVNAILQLSTH
jgi:hypothetical protein